MRTNPYLLLFYIYLGFVASVLLANVTALVWARVIKRKTERL